LLALSFVPDAAHTSFRRKLSFAWLPWHTHALQPGDGAGELLEVLVTSSLAYRAFIPESSAM